MDDDLGRGWLDVDRLARPQQLRMSQPIKSETMRAITFYLARKRIDLRWRWRCSRQHLRRRTVSERASGTHNRLAVGVQPPVALDKPHFQAGKTYCSVSLF
jgi:hypothetical protein